MKYLLAIIIVLSTLIAQATPSRTQADSLVILFGNKTRLVVHSNDKEGIRQLSNYDINKIIRDMGMKLDSAKNGETYVVIDGNKVQRYLQDTVLVVTRQNGTVTVTVKESESGQGNRSNDDNSSKRSRYNRSSNWGLGLDWGAIGLNSLIQQGSNAGYSSESYNLRPLGSRYVSLGLVQKPTIIRGKTASLKLYYGIGVSWNNYMFDNNVIVQKGPTGVVFADAGRDLIKSKLTVCSINVPFVPRVTFYNESGRKVFHLGLGAYAGYRVDSYTKVKETNGDKNHDHSDFYLNNFRYGLMAHIGIIQTNFFVKYDLNPLFVDGKGPNVRALSFGIGF